MRFWSLGGQRSIRVSIETLPEASPRPPELPQPLATAAPQSKRNGWPVEATITAWLILIGGAIFRIRCFCHWRSLWLDEIYLTHSIVTRGFYRLLFEPLDYWQGAPPGFLVLERVCVDLFGVGERRLRLPSLVAGLASLPLFFFLARRALTLRATLLSVILFSCLWPMIYFSEEVKPYSTDVAVTLAILLSGIAAWQEAKSTKRLIVYGLVGALGLFFSYPAVLVLAGSFGVVLVMRALKAKRQEITLMRAVAPMILFAAVWGGLEWVNLRVFLRPLMHGAAHEGLIRDWTRLGGFPPASPNAALEWLWNSFRAVMAGYASMYLTASDLGMVAAIAGIIALVCDARQPDRVFDRRGAACLFFATLPLAIAAAFMHRYPFADRLTLYVVPILCLFIGAGIDHVWGYNGMGRAALGSLFAILLIGSPVKKAWWDLWHPAGREETSQLYSWLKREWKPGDLLVLSHMAAPSFDYYAPKVGLAGLEQLWLSPPVQRTADDPSLLQSSAQGIALEPWFYRHFLPSRPVDEAVGSGYVVLQPDHSGVNDDPSHYLDDVDAILRPDPAWLWPPSKRIWVVFAHVWDDKNLEVDTLCVPELDRRSHLVRKHLEELGAAAYLYEMNNSSTPGR